MGNVSMRDHFSATLAVKSSDNGSKQHTANMGKVLSKVVDHCNEPDAITQCITPQEHFPLSEDCGARSQGKTAVSSVTGQKSPRSQGKTAVKIALNADRRATESATLTDRLIQRKTLVFIRHGHGCHNDKQNGTHGQWKGLGGICDPPLTNLGAEQAGTLPKCNKLTAILARGARVECSALRRAQDTARHALQQYAGPEGIAVQVVPHCNEMNKAARAVSKVCRRAATLVNGSENTPICKEMQTKMWDMKHTATPLGGGGEEESAAVHVHYPTELIQGQDWPSEYLSSAPRKYLKRMFELEGDETILFGHSNWFAALVKELKMSAGSKIQHCEVCVLHIEADSQLKKFWCDNFEMANEAGSKIECDATKSRQNLNTSQQDKQMRSQIKLQQTAVAHTVLNASPRSMHRFANSGRVMVSKPSHTFRR